MRELLNLAWGEFITFLVVFARVGVAFAVVPFFGAEIIPRRITALLVIFLSMVIMPVVPGAKVAIVDLNVLDFGMILLQQLLVGLAIGLAVEIVFSGVQIAGELMGFQMGFSIANVVDPMTGATAPITANVLYLTAFLLFFSIGGHHMLIKAMVDSFAVIPPGALLPTPAYCMSAVMFGANMFAIGVKVAAPVVCALLLVNVAFSVIARALPQMNVFLMAFPVTIALGLVFLAMVIRMMPYLMESSLGAGWGFITSVMSLYAHH